MRIVEDRLRILLIGSEPFEVCRPDPQGDRLSRLAFILEKAGHKTARTQARTIPELIRKCGEAAPDLVFSAVSHTKDEPKENVHRALASSKVPFVGSDAEVLELALAKHRLKKRWIERGIATPDFFVVRGEDLGAPFLDRAFIGAGRDSYLVKPAAEGNSRGIREENIVRNRKELDSRIRTMATEFDTLLVERFLGFAPDRREFTAALVGNGPDRLLAPAEIVLPADRGIRLVRTEDKENGKAVAVPIEEGPLRRRVAAFAGAAFDAAGIRDYGRCDMLYADGRLYAIEINGQPMMPDAWFHACCRGAGLSAEEYPAAIIRAAFDRYRQRPGRTT